MTTPTWARPLREGSCRGRSRGDGGSGFAGRRQSPGRAGTGRRGGAARPQALARQRGRGGARRHPARRADPDRAGGGHARGHPGRAVRQCPRASLRCCASRWTSGRFSPPSRVPPRPIWQACAPKAGLAGPEAHGSGPSEAQLLRRGLVTGRDEKKGGGAREEESAAARSRKPREEEGLSGSRGEGVCDCFSLAVAVKIRRCCVCTMGGAALLPCSNCIRSPDLFFGRSCPGSGRIEDGFHRENSSSLVPAGRRCT